MCLSVPGKIEEIFQHNNLAMAKVNFGGIKRSACLEYVPTAKKGDYVLVHVGFAISILDQEEAERGLRMLKSSGEEQNFKEELEQNKDQFINIAENA